MSYHPTILATIETKKATLSKIAITFKTKKDAQKGKSTQKKVYSEFGPCGKKIHPEERCWQGAGAYLKAKRNRPEDSADSNPDSKMQ